MLGVLTVSVVLLGLLLGTGAGAVTGSAGPDTDEQFDSSASPAEVNESSLAVSFVESTVDTSDPADNDVVVHFEDEFVVSGEYAGNTPPEPAITAGGEPLVIRDGIVETRDGEYEATIGDDKVTQSTGFPGIQVNGTNLEVNDNGEVQTANEAGQRVEVGDNVAEYENIDEEIVDIEFEDLDGVEEGKELEVNITFTNYEYGGVEKVAELTGVDSSGSYEEDIGSWQDVNLDGGEQVTKTFEETTEPGYNAIDELQLEIGDGEMVTEAIHIAEAKIAINSFDANTPVEGEDLRLDAEVERIGAVPAEELSANISIGDELVESKELNIDPGENETITYETNSSNVSIDEVSIETAYRYDIDSDGNEGVTSQDEVEITVVSRQDHNESMSANITNEPSGNLSEELEVDAEIDYDGDVPDGETEVPTKFLVDGSVANETNVTVEDGSPTDVTFATDLDEDTVPVTNVSVETPGENDLIEFERNVTTAFSDVNDPFASNESLEAVVEVENAGETPEIVNLTVSVDDPDSVESDGTETRELSVNASETIEAEFVFEPTDHASSQIEVTADAGESSDTATTNRPVFEVEDVELEGADDPGSGLTMSGNVTNTGEIPDNQTVQFTLDGELVAEENVTLDANESETVSAEIEPPEEDGEYGFGMTANNETASAGDSAEGSAHIDASGTSLLDRLSSLALPLLLLGLLVVGVFALKYRDDPEAFRTRVAALRAKVEDAVQGLVGGGGTIIVENGLPRESTVRLQVKDTNGVVFQKDVQLADGEQREFPSLPDGGQFEVGVGVDDIASHSEVFQKKTDNVGIVLRPDGITIAEL